MANEHLDDFEQAEQVKKWILDNGSALVLGVTLGIGALFGYQYWERYQVEQRLAAATAYSDLVESLQSDELVDAGALDRFQQAFGDHAYTALAALSIAAQQVEDDDIDGALVSLEKAAQIGTPEAVRSIANLRIARLKISQGKHSEAADILAKVGPDFSALVSEIRGDALLAAGDHNAARAAYDEALADAQISPQARRLVEMKRDNLNSSAGVDS